MHCGTSSPHAAVVHEEAAGWCLALVFIAGVAGRSNRFNLVLNMKKFHKPALECDWFWFLLDQRWKLVLVPIGPEDGSWFLKTSVSLETSSRGSAPHPDLLMLMNVRTSRSS